MKLPDSPIFLVGYMACGKTTFGRALAKALDREFIDLDLYIEARFRKSISTIFAESGESGFRKVEAAMLREVGEFENVVVACGGGTPCFLDNMDYMKSAGLTVWLRASVERIVARLAVNRSKRPLMASKSDAELRAAVEEGLGKRECDYAKAEIEFESDELEDRRQISSSVARFLSLFAD